MYVCVYVDIYVAYYKNLTNTTQVSYSMALFSVALNSVFKWTWKDTIQEIVMNRIKHNDHLSKP